MLLMKENNRNANGHTPDQVFAIKQKSYALKNVINELVISIKMLNSEISSYKDFIEELNDINNNISRSVENIESGYMSFFDGGYNSEGQDVSRGKLREVSNKLEEQKEIIIKIISLADEKLKDKIIQRNSKIKQYEDKNTEKINIRNNWKEAEIISILDSILELQNYFTDSSSITLFKY